MSNYTLLNITVIAALILFTLLPYILLLFAIWYGKKRRVLPQRSVRIILRFVLIFALLDVASYIFREFFSNFFGGAFERFSVSFGTTPLLFVTNMLPSMIAVWLVLRGFPSLSLATEEDDNKSKNIVALQQAVKKIFHSDHFFTALSSALPKGEKDKEYGLDHIPFILQNINQRRKHFEGRSIVFLIITILVGIIFSGVIVFFGYLLVNEEAAGTPKTIAQIREEVSTIRRDLNLILPDYFENREFQDAAGMTLSKLNVSTDLNQMNTDDKVQVAIAEAQRTGNIAELYQKLQQLEKEFRSTSSNFSNNEAYQIYLRNLEQVNFQIAQFLGRQNAAIPNLDTSLENLERMITNVNNSLGRPEAQTAEVLKRLALSLVVSSFFLVILRYVAGIYRSHYQEMLKAQQDDLSVRKFYVSFKGSESDTLTRSKIISSFFSIPNQTSMESEDSNTSSDNSLELSKDDISNILKELLSVLAKKL
jgi:hypothetical protein